MSALGILLLAVGLAAAAAEPGHLAGLLLSVGPALHAAASGTARWIGGTQRCWLLTCALPTVVFPRSLAAVDTAYHDGLRDRALVWLLAVPVRWQFLYARRHSALLGLGKLGSSEG